MSYKKQPKPNDLAEAILFGEEFIGIVCMSYTAKNIFFGHGLTELFKKAVGDVVSVGGARYSAIYVKDPELRHE